MADTEKYPSEYNRTPEFESERNRRFSSLAERLVMVHRELGDQEGAEDWQAKMEADIKTAIGL